MTDRPWMRPRAAGRVGPELRRRRQKQRGLLRACESFGLVRPIAVGPWHVAAVELAIAYWEEAEYALRS